MMEEMKMCHRNLAVYFYDYKKVYDKMHHDYMLRMYTWMGILENLVALLNELMRKWKTKFEIWSNGDTKISRWINVMYYFLQSRILPVRGLSVNTIAGSRRVLNE